ncbi:MAG: hypothetical protein WDN28_07050 [Chthoniobacter sp.]
MRFTLRLLCLADLLGFAGIDHDRQGAGRLHITNFPSAARTRFRKSSCSRRSRANSRSRK